jgi:hypothetical protein
MRTSVLLTILGAVATLSACQKAEEPPEPKMLSEAPVPDTACVDCKWENFVARPIPVQRIECTNAGKPEHCHLTTEDFQPKREVTITYDKTTGAYHWKLATLAKPQESMDCPNLAASRDDRRVIEGTCIIPDSDQGPQVHFFRATVLPREDDPIKGKLSAQFRHTPFDGASQPVHDGNIHTNH